MVKDVYISTDDVLISTSQRNLIRHEVPLQPRLRVCSKPGFDSADRPLSSLSLLPLLPSLSQMRAAKTIPVGRYHESQPADAMYTAVP